MKLTQLLTAFSTSIVLNFASQLLPAQAATFSEVGDAGQSLTNTQNVGTDINAILGRINTTTDADLYQINLASGLFMASTVRNVTNNLDTMLWLFDFTGKGIVGNDDSLNTSQSTIQANLTAGTYYLGISNYDIKPTSASGFIFNYSNGSQKTKLLQPTGVGGNGSLTGDWKIGLNASAPRTTGQYRIVLNQSTISYTQPVPESSAAIAI